MSADLASHVRIDEGLKRPRYPHKLPVRNSTLRTGKLADLKPEDVLASLLEDQTQSQLAERLGVHRTALNQWLLRTIPDEWQAVQVARALSALEQAKEEMGVAVDALSLARSRELVKVAQWELERLLSRLYGDKQDTAPKLPPILIINLPGSTPLPATLTIEHDPSA